MKVEEINMKKKQEIISWISFILFFSITKINFDFYILEPTAYYNDYSNKTSPKQYEIVPNNDLNNNNDININVMYITIPLTSIVKKKFGNIG